ncbi:PD-(D/E)XK nuclease superfamily protein [Halobiforma haloterrestris]|uniref:PD-(D/E)XK nuclease superfamily protein n=1 Tax=Natronobacterium haloterrestre TaxID=148448 RepID=A0A1I1DG30_NATHA|nr:PD-(D/E)XK nuclease family protein [Halobiforma haloterrestris]SFB73891.1 PD-(D/E)XK nuclease superfamily protein [Halobiforma haloterrestris]
MTDRDAETPPDSISVEGLRTYLQCPRRYEFAHVDGLEGGETDGEDEATVERVALLRRALCDALVDAAGDDPDPETLAERATRRLATLWDDHDEHFHSRAQRRHERRVLEATLEAYVDRVGAEHAAGIGRLEDEREADRPLVGPDLELSTTVAPASGAADGGSRASESEVDSDLDPVTLEAPVDYLYADGSSLVAVRFVPTLWPLGYLRYRSDWERVEDRFVDHFDPEADAFDPGPAAALLETAVVLDGLRNYRDRLGLTERTCRYVQIPLADRSNASINWVRETVETDIEVVDLTDVYVDHHTFGMTHEHRNETVDGRLESIVDRIRAGAFDPGERWDDVRDEECPDCAYRVCCGDYLETEVGFDA